MDRRPWSFLGHSTSLAGTTDTYRSSDPAAVKYDEASLSKRVARSRIKGRKQKGDYKKLLWFKQPCQLHGKITPATSDLSKFLTTIRTSELFWIIFRETHGCDRTNFGHLCPMQLSLFSILHRSPYFAAYSWGLSKVDCRPWPL